jgi:hypothetical protein
MIIPSLNLEIALEAIFNGTENEGIASLADSREGATPRALSASQERFRDGER